MVTPLPSCVLLSAYRARTSCTGRDICCSCTGSTYCQGCQPFIRLSPSGSDAVLSIPPEPVVLGCVPVVERAALLLLPRPRRWLLLLRSMLLRPSAWAAEGSAAAPAAVTEQVLRSLRPSLQSKPLPAGKLAKLEPLLCRYISKQQIMSPVRPLPALQWTTTTLCGCCASQSAASAQNCCTTSRAGVCKHSTGQQRCCA